MSDLLTRNDLLSLADDLDALTNLWGDPLTEQSRARLFDAVTEPSEAAWEEVHGLIISRRFTLWQAVVAFSDYHVLVRDLAGRWPQVPTTGQLLAGLHGAAEFD